jgi:hypothetical protein
MKRFHIAIATSHFTASVADYSKRLGAPPCVIQDGRYALWRTELLNFNISCKPGQALETVRHIGFEDDAETGIREECDVNGLIWEYFSQQAQEKEIRDKFPQAVFREPYSSRQ